jgi:hypothetical protein
MCMSFRRHEKKEWKRRDGNHRYKKISYSYKHIIIHLISWIILLWEAHKNRVNWIKWQSKSVHKTQLAFFFLFCWKGDRKKQTRMEEKRFLSLKRILLQKPQRMKRKERKTLLLTCACVWLLQRTLKWIKSVCIFHRATNWIILF